MSRRTFRSASGMPATAEAGSIGAAAGAIAAGAVAGIIDTEDALGVITTVGAGATGGGGTKRWGCAVLTACCTWGCVYIAPSAWPAAATEGGGQQWTVVIGTWLGKVAGANVAATACCGALAEYCGGMVPTATAEDAYVGACACVTRPSCTVVVWAATVGWYVGGEDCTTIGTPE